MCSFYILHMLLLYSFISILNWSDKSLPIATVDNQPVGGWLIVTAKV